MKLGILVNEGPFTHQASDTAYHFAKAAIKKAMKLSESFSITMALITLINLVIHQVTIVI